MSVNLVTEKKKFDGSVVKVAECIIGDSTGIVALIARNGKWDKEFNVVCLEQLDVVKEGTTITVMNALARITNRLLKVELDKWSRVTPSEQVSRYQTC